MTIKDTRKTHSPTTRMLHLALLVAVLHQLGTSLLIGRGDATSARPAFAFLSHEWIGMGALCILAIYWLWTLIRTGETDRGALLPWFSPARRQAVWRDALDHGRAIRRCRLPGSGSMALAHAVHGLGLLLATAMALSGAATLLAGTGGTAYMLVLAIHTSLANLMWAYLIGHASVAVLHHVSGHGMVREMLTVGIGGPG